jgi:hypothetical protein
MKILFLAIYFIILSIKINAHEISFIKGNEIITSLLNELGQTTTSFRSEEKTVLKKSLFKKAYSNFTTHCNDKRLKTSQRDIALENGKNATFTFYGKRIYFYNLGIKTNIKFRVRFYLATDDIGKDFFLANNETLYGFIEIKIKNPSPSLRGISVKTRLKLNEALIKRLCQLNPKNPHYDRQLNLLKKDMLNENQNKDTDKVDKFFSLLRTLSKINSNFKKPSNAISYERRSIKIEEEKYKKDNKLIKRNLGRIEYQLTIDENIKSYKSQALFDNTHSLAYYFKTIAKRDMIKTYPQDSLVVEIKTPTNVFLLNDKKRSQPHKALQKYLFYPIMNSAYVYPGFKKNKGKRHHMFSDI